jgi:Ca2+-binding RTX toxin-like protein
VTQSWDRARDTATGVNISNPVVAPGGSTGGGGAVAYYLTIDGVNGGSTNAQFQGAFAVGSYTFDIEGTPPPPQGAGTSRLDFPPLTVNLDLTTGFTALLNSMTSDRLIPSIRLQGVNANGATLYDLKLGNASLNHYFDTNTGQDRLTFVYGQFSLTTTPVNANGSLGTPVTQSWNLVNNRPGVNITNPVPAPNTAPILAKAIGNPNIVTTNSTLNYTIPAGTFSDANSDPLIYSATLANGTLLPSWLSINGTTGNFSGIMLTSFTGVLNLEVTATDPFLASAVTQFTLTVTRNVSTGSSNPDSLNGSGVPDSLIGAEDNDTLRGFDNADTLSGGAGADRLFGGAGNDTLDGGTGADVLEGEAGNDILFGADGNSGNDTLLGGSGDDAYNVDGNNDVITEADNGGTEYVYAYGNYTLPTNVEHLVLELMATNGTGNELGNFILGNSTLDTTLQGLVGNDTLIGGSGNDTLIGGTENDYLDGRQGKDSLEGGNGNDILVGDGGNDTLIGSTGDDLLSAGEGIDSLEGGAGNDTLFGGTDNDVLVGGTENDYLAGDAGADSITGGEGSDTLLGADSSTGNDTLIGGIGDDIYNVDGINDLIIEAANEGTEYVYAFGNYTLPTNVEHLVLVGSAIVGIGNELSNFILGNATQPGTLQGLAGDDLLIGGSGNDTLSGGTDNDYLEGRQGIDQFLFGGSGVGFNSLGVDTIVGLAADKLVLSQSTFTTLTIDALSASDFATVTLDTDAATSSGLIVYNSSNGNLFYNPDRIISGFGTGGQFAILAGNPGVAASDFTIVA